MESRSDSEWERFFQRAEFDYRWTVPWWGLTRVRVPEAASVLRVPSLSVLTFYSP